MSSTINKVACLLFIASAPVAGSHAAELRLLPPTSTLVGPHAQQRLLVVAEEAGKVIGERTTQSTFASSNPSVATVDKTGVVKAAGDGEATITATHDGKTTTAIVNVTKSKDEFTWSFRNHVTPLMTKAGCNSGACHGALAGKGGMKLSLRGYAPSVDHFVLTRQALGRRVDRLHPERSLMLAKPTMAVPHGGGQRVDVGSRDYQVLADWIASGAVEPKADDLAVQRLEVFPAEAVLKPKDTLQVIVRAWYSDGHAEDVTPWVKFASSEDLVANVDDAGKVSVKGLASSRHVLYSNLVAARASSRAGLHHRSACPRRHRALRHRWLRPQKLERCVSRPPAAAPIMSSSAVLSRRGRHPPTPRKCRVRRRQVGRQAAAS